MFEVGPQAGNSADCTYPDGPANVNVNVQVADQDGGIEAEALSVTVLNAVPAVTDVVANPARLPVEGGTSLITVSATDVPGDTLDFSFDCDGDAIFEVGPLAGNFTACTFTAEDQSVNSVNVRVEDGDGGVAAGDVTVSVGAITLLVTKTGDTNDGICNEDCSLREAIDVALSGDSIDVPAGTYTLTLGSELVIGTSLTLTGAGSGDTVIQAAAEPNVANSRVFLITGDSNVAIGDVTVRHGRAAGNGWGGGIVSTIGSRLTITNSTISGNWAQAAGGISNTGTLILTHSTINGNRVGSWAGGFYNGGTLTMTNSKVRDNTASAGSGGIHNFPGTLILNNSTVSGNSAGTDSGGISNIGTMILNNSTVSGNFASNKGGGIYNRYQGNTVTLTNSTVSGNSASDGGGIYNEGGTVTLVNTIVANNLAGGDCTGDGVVTSLGHNLDSDGSCDLAATGDLSNVDPLLGPLQDNGGLTFTHALLPGSPAIDAGDDSAAPDTDQRGVARPLDGDANGVAVSDIGAYESETRCLTFSDLTITPVEVAPGASITIDMNVQNFCEETTLDTNIELRINGALAQVQPVSVPPLGQVEVSFSYTPTAEGTYTAELADQRGIVPSVEGEFMAVIPPQQQHLVQGSVRLEGMPNPITGARITFSGQVTTQVISNPVDGSFQVQLPPDSYTITIEKDGFLTAAALDVIVDHDTTLPEVSLLWGDANGDDVVDVQDVAIPAKNLDRTESPWPLSE